MDSKKVSLVVAIAALVIAVVSVFVSVMVQDNPTKPVGAIGTLLAEDYVPVIKFNEGYYSAFDITTTGTITGATISGTTVTLTTLTVSGATDVSTFTQGGGVSATSTSGTTVPLLASNFDVENVIDVTLNVQDATLSFPASSTLSALIPNSGDTREIFIRNASTTAAMDLTISGGTGVLLKTASSSNIVLGDTDGANYAIVRLIRKANTDIEAFLEIFLD